MTGLLRSIQKFKNKIAIMKRLVFLMMGCLLAVCGCNQIDDSFETMGSNGRILLSPSTPLIRDGVVLEQEWSVVNFNKEGGEATVIAYFPEEEGVPLNDRYITMLSDWDIPSGQLEISREKMSDFKTAYHLKMAPNILGKAYSIVITLTDTTRKNSSGLTIESKATIVVNQAGE